jgi:hypothetical protein
MALVIWPAAAAFAQAPAAGSTPDDTPSIRVGATIFANYSIQDEPKATDADGNTITKNGFDVTRSYINVTGNISHVVAFRVTPDITRETNTASSLNGSLVFRVKYAYLQTNLDEWTGRGSFARFGIQQTPYLDYLEGVYRYRFQGTMFAERAGYFSSADAGVSYRYQFPANYGDVHAGIYNGENYQKPEANNQKDFMVRGSLRPFAAGAPILRGLRGALFYDYGHYQTNAERKRLIAVATFEQQYVNIGFEYLNAHDQTSAATANVHGRGYSIWATPKESANSVGWEGLIRYDHHTPNTAFDSQKQNRFITGLAYWFPHQGAVSTALMIDYDGQILENATVPANKSVFVHALVNF